MKTLTKKDGELTIIIKANGQPFKSFKAQSKGGELQRLEQNRLEFEPHHEFISPRFIDVSSGSSSQYKMRDMYWVRRARSSNESQLNSADARYVLVSCTTSFIVGF